jgi:D-beta-D-heptose 7-phosphate kinase/D-beta-D-heptose 1-phosphate adenosyltransferase
MSKEKVVICSGYFDPLHVGHIEYLKMAKSMGDTLVVIVNNRKQALIKKADEFMDERDRLDIVFHLDMVDEVLMSVDEDKTVCKSLEMVAQFKPMAELTFCNGGDRHFGDIPEAKVCSKLNIKMVDGLGEKIRSSSDMTGLVEYDEPNAFRR